VTEKGYFRPDVIGAGEYDRMKEPRYGEIATFMRAPLARGRLLGGEAGPIHSARLLVVRDVSWPIVDLPVKPCSKGCRQVLTDGCGGRATDLG
jgi:hypothetical protein